MSNIEKYKAGEVLAALATDPKLIIEALQENMGGDSISRSNLTKVKVPSGGATAFEIPSLMGDTYEKELIGAIVYHTPGRAYYDRPYEEAAEDERFPVCYSDDGKIGIGNPGGSCLECPLSKFESAKDKKGGASKGQACSERKELYFMRGNCSIPEIISVPPTSLKGCRDFLFKLATSQIKFYEALISITLRKEKNGAGVEYAEMDFKFIRALNEDEKASALQWNTMMRMVATDAAASRRRMIEGGA